MKVEYCVFMYLCIYDCLQEITKKMKVRILEYKRKCFTSPYNHECIFIFINNTLICLVIRAKIDGEYDSYKNSNHLNL